MRLTFLLDCVVGLFSCFFSCFTDGVGAVGAGGGGRGFSSFTCVVGVGSVSSVINLRPRSLRPNVGKSSVDESDGGGGIP